MVTVPRRFGVLRFLSTVFKVLAWMGLLLSLLTAIALAVAAPWMRNLLVEQGFRPEPLWMGPGGVVLVGLALVLAGLIGFLLLYALAEQILVQLAIEENTRMTAALLLRQDRELREHSVEERYLFR